MEFEAGSHRYTSAKIDTFKQLFVIKRLAPAMRDILTGEVIALFMSEKKDRDALMMFGAFGSMAGAIGKMSDDDIQYLVDAALIVTKRFQKEGVWSPIMANGVLAFQDITAAQILQITEHVLRDNLSGFFDELRSIWGAEEKQETKPIS